MIQFLEFSGDFKLDETFHEQTGRQSRYRLLYNLNIDKDMKDTIPDVACLPACLCAENYLKDNNIAGGDFGYRSYVAIMVKRKLSCILSQILHGALL